MNWRRNLANLRYKFFVMQYRMRVAKIRNTPNVSNILGEMFVIKWLQLQCVIKIGLKLVD